MKKLTLGFAYTGPKTNYPDDEDNGPSLALIKAEKAVIAAMTAAGLLCQHEYTWPDGSLYKSTLVGDSPEDVTSAIDVINKALDGHDIYVSEQHLTNIQFDNQTMEPVIDEEEHEQAERYLSIASDLVYVGRVPLVGPDVPLELEAWFRAFATGPDKRLLFASTVVPFRFAAAAAKFYRDNPPDSID